MGFVIRANEIKSHKLDGKYKVISCVEILGRIALEKLIGEVVQAIGEALKSIGEKRKC